jgi:environmental stress-induced protein Ves
MAPHEVQRRTPADYRVMPWKNGRGSTTEIAVHPADATVTDERPFLYRLSLAALDGPGPFSPFPGVDRIILQTSGKPMTLGHGARGEHALSPLVPYRFSGDAPTDGRLEGRATDLNVMTRRGRATAHAEVVTLEDGAAWRVPRSATHTLVHLLSGALGGEATAVAGETLVAPAAPEALRLHAQGAVHAVLVMVRF